MTVTLEIPEELAQRLGPEAARMSREAAGREYVTSDYVRLELIPKATFHTVINPSLSFYDTFFRANIRCIPTSSSLITPAMEHGCATGIRGIDALHIACADFAGAEEFIATETPTKPIHRTKLIKVICIRPGEG